MFFLECLERLAAVARVNSYIHPYDLQQLPQVVGVPDVPFADGMVAVPPALFPGTQRFVQQCLYEWQEESELPGIHGVVDQPMENREIPPVYFRLGPKQLNVLIGRLQLPDG